MRLLYIDDDRVQGLLFTEACRQLVEWEVETACSAAEAVEMVEHWKPRVLVIDLHLSDATGLDLLPRLRALCLPREIAAALYTADDSPTVAQSAALAGFDACWSKPLDMRGLPQALAHLLRQVP